jgi:DNA modification methylase
MSEVLIHSQEVVPIDSLTVDGSNPNEMNKDQWEALGKNIQRYGFLVPIITNRDGLIADGQHRWEKAKELGMTHVPIIRLDVEEVDRRMLRQILNKLRGEHDKAKDHIEFKAILEAGMAQELLDLLGKTDTKLVEFLANTRSSPVTDELDVEAAYHNPQFHVEFGDVWEMGEHRLVCGDSAWEPRSYEFLLQGEKAQMIFTDPPYNVNYEQEQNGETNRILNDSMNANDWRNFVNGFMSKMLEHVEGSVYICMSSQEWPTLMNAFEANGGHWSSTIIWVKDRFVLGRKDYHAQFEPILHGEANQDPQKNNQGPDAAGHSMLYGWKEGIPHKWYGGRNSADVWFLNRPNVNDLHPTMKPVELVQRAIANSSYMGDIVLDPFAGSGTTAIACQEYKRKARLIEKDPKYCSVILERFQKATGITPTKVEKKEKESEQK